MHWKVQKFWKGADVYIIGGGSSLADLDKDLLKNKRVIGCNDSYRYFGDVVDICFFGDYKWFLLHRHYLKDYKGFLITNAEHHIPQDRVLQVQRRARGISANPSWLGWYHNTGASAIHLALLLGASRIFLLGFDMHLDKETGKQNWYPEKLKNKKPNPKVLKKFLDNFKHLAKHAKKAFPDVEIINANMDSSLEVFKKVKRQDVLK